MYVLSSSSPKLGRGRTNNNYEVSSVALKSCGHVKLGTFFITRRTEQLCILYELCSCAPTAAAVAGVYQESIRAQQQSTPAIVLSPLPHWATEAQFYSGCLCTNLIRMSHAHAACIHACVTSEYTIRREATSISQHHY